MKIPEGTNQKLVTVLRSVTQELTRVQAAVWTLSYEKEDACVDAGIASVTDWSNEGLIKEIERRANMINERTRRYALLKGGESSEALITVTQADAIYQRYCGKNNDTTSS